MKKVLFTLLTTLFCIQANFVDSTLGFSAKFPSPPVKNSQSTTDELGTWVNHDYLLLLDTEDSLALSVVVKDYTHYKTDGISPDMIITTSLRMLVEMTGGTKLTSQDIDGPNQGRSFYFKSQEGTNVQGVLFWKNKNLYIAIGMSKSNRNSRKIKKFIKSFKLL